MKIKIDREHREKAGQEAIEKKYEDFYEYKTYKNEERVQLKKKINDDMFQRAKERQARAQDNLMEERAVYQQKFIEQMGDNIREFYYKMQQDKERQERKVESEAKAFERIKKHEEIILTEQQMKDVLNKFQKGDKKKKKGREKGKKKYIPPIWSLVLQFLLSFDSCFLFRF